MANERKTENIVRKHFAKYEKNIIIEEQTSDNSKIMKLLKSASKSGKGAGHPEFIISFKDNSDLLIVIECKADTSKHESKKRDKYKEYAVDGVLLYSSYLSKEFDVISIAVSGETKRNLQVSHFMQLKGKHSYEDFAGDVLLSISNYIDLYMKSPQKINQDLTQLLLYTKKLNEKLQINRISESDRGLLISGILLSLEDNVFSNGFLSSNDAQELADLLYQAIERQVRKLSIDAIKKKKLINSFSFIKTDTTLTTKNGYLKGLIIEIRDNVYSYKNNGAYYDIIGQMYIEFLRYANSDKGLGIVLTPPHIAELFAELAQVNINSKVYDNCAGTGGFLIAAMNKMIKDAKGNATIIRRIKSSQLFGVEYNAKIYALAVSNMYIHEDGKTNIISGDCFDKDVIKTIKAKKPNVGFLNPPYKANKSEDTEELEFVLNNLNCITKNGTCIAIVPMERALSTSPKSDVYKLKQEILKKHTLEAVLSMPGDLFMNSKVSSVTCVMIFTAHIPHPENKEVFFGYYKDDGFVKRKNVGRVDKLDRWESIKKKWVETYLNKKEIPGFSVMRCVSIDDEWCAEAYMETDYSVLSEKDFEDTTLKYVTFLHRNHINQRKEIDNEKTK